MRRGHDHAGDLAGTKGIDGKQGDQSGVDAAREGDADVAEAVLAHVVAQTENQGGVDLGEVVERLDEKTGLGWGDVADQQFLLKLSRAGEDVALGVNEETVAIEDQLVLSTDQIAESEVDA